MTGIPGNIGFDLAEMMKNASKLISAVTELPSVAVVSENAGPTDAASGPFRHELRWTAQQLGLEVLKISDEITSLEGAIRFNQESLTAHDDAVEGDLTQLLGFIDAAPTSSTPAAPATAPAPQTSSPGGDITFE